METHRKWLIAGHGGTAALRGDALAMAARQFPRREVH